MKTLPKNYDFFRTKVYSDFKMLCKMSVLFIIVYRRYSEKLVFGAFANCLYHSSTNAQWIRLRMG